MPRPRRPRPGRGFLLHVQLLKLFQKGITEMDFQSWAELRASLREALDALETAKELIPWEDSHLCPERVSLRAKVHRGK